MEKLECNGSSKSGDQTRHQESVMDGLVRAALRGCHGYGETQNLLGFCQRKVEEREERILVREKGISKTFSGGRSGVRNVHV